MQCCLQSHPFPKGTVSNVTCTNVIFCYRLDTIQRPCDFLNPSRTLNRKYSSDLPIFERSWGSTQKDLMHGRLVLSRWLSHNHLAVISTDIPKKTEVARLHWNWFELNPANPNEKKIETCAMSLKQGRLKLRMKVCLCSCRRNWNLNRNTCVIVILQTALVNDVAIPRTVTSYQTVGFW